MSVHRYTREGLTSTVYSMARDQDVLTTLRYLVDSYSNEPLIAIRGRDLLALPVIGAYANLAKSMGLDVGYQRAMGKYDLVNDWQQANLSLRKVPD